MKQIICIILSLVCIFTSYSKQEISNTFDFKPELQSSGINRSATPEEVRKRLAALDTEIEMRYTPEVQSYIDQYMKHGRRKVASFLALSTYYLPIFERALREAGLPEELKYLPVIESGLDPKATSNMGAAGLWQFMAVAARGYDMKISSAVDERRDPYISSDRACRMLKDLYEKFGDWGLVLAAYNAGPGAVQRALKRAGGSNHSYWTVRQHLPAQTRKYVPAFIAMNYIMNYYAEHNIPEVTIERPLVTDTVRISKKVSFKEIASACDITVEDLRKLNPHLRGDMISGTTERPSNLILPSATARDYKIKLGRPVTTDEPLYADNNTGTKAITTQSKPTGALAMNDTKRSERRDTWNDKEYSDVPSKSMPGVYVREARTTSSQRDKKKKKPSAR